MRIGGKGEPMKGLMNNEEAVRVFHNLKDSMINPIHQIYNLGYNQGFKDGASEAVQKLVDNIMDKRRADGNTD